MANVKIEGMDELVLTLQKSDMFDDDTQKEMLNVFAYILIYNISD